MPKLAKTCLLAVSVLALAALCACSAPAAGDGENSGASSADAQAGSLQAVHTEEVWATVEADHSKKMCLSCHPRETIVEKTENYADVFVCGNGLYTFVIPAAPVYLH